MLTAQETPKLYSAHKKSSVSSYRDEAENSVVPLIFARHSARTHYGYKHILLL